MIGSAHNFFVNRRDLHLSTTIIAVIKCLWEMYCGIRNSHHTKLAVSYLFLVAISKKISLEAKRLGERG